MPSETDSLIAETLRLDGEMIDPATFKIARYEHGGGRVSFENGNERELIADFYDKAHREGFILFRTSAPRLARIAKMQSEAMAWIGGDGPKPSWFAEAIKREPRRNYGDIDMQVISRYVLAEIEKIARDGAG